MPRIATRRAARAASAPPQPLQPLQPLQPPQPLQPLQPLPCAGRATTCRLLPDGLTAAGIWIQGVGGYDAGDVDRLEMLIRAGLAAGVAHDGGAG